MSPQHSLGSPVPPGKHLQKSTSKLLAALLDRVAVAIVDDDENQHVMVRDILDRAQDFCCIGSYSSGEAALAGIPQSGAHIVLMDIRMPGMSGIECTRQLKVLMPHLVILMITALEDRRTIDLARKCGAEDFLLKPLSVGQFLATLRFWRPDGKAKSSSGWLPSIQSIKGFHDLHLSQLTPKERELLEHLAGGELYKEIAPRMGLTEPVVRNRAHELYVKIGVSNRTEAALWFWNQRHAD